MKFFRTMWLLMLALAFVTAAQAQEGESSAQGASNRMEKTLGAYIGIVGDPFPSILGVNAAYNITDFMRASVGYGQIEVTTGISSNGTSLTTSKTTVTTIGAGVTGFMPGWDITPTAGLHFSNVSTTGSGEISVQGFKGNGSVVYGSLGGDWQSDSGFNLSAGYNIPFGKGSGSFYAAAGWFFDVL